MMLLAVLAAVRMGDRSPREGTPCLAKAVGLIEKFERLVAFCRDATAIDHARTTILSAAARELRVAQRHAIRIGRPDHLLSDANARLAYCIAVALVLTSKKKRRYLRAALREIESAITHEPTNADYYRLRGEILWALGKKEAGVDSFGKAVELERVRRHLSAQELGAGPT